MITKAVIDILLASSGIQALVDTRISPNIIKQDSIFPAIYVSSDRMEKPNCFNPSKVRTGAIEVGVYSDTYANVSEIVDAIRSALDDFSGLSSNVGINIFRGSELGDQYDEQEKKHVKVIEFSAVAQLP